MVERKSGIRISAAGADRKPDPVEPTDIIRRIGRRASASYPDSIVESEKGMSGTVEMLAGGEDIGRRTVHLPTCTGVGMIMVVARGVVGVLERQAYYKLLRVAVYPTMTSSDSMLSTHAETVQGK